MENRSENKAELFHEKIFKATGDDAGSPAKAQVSNEEIKDWVNNRFKDIDELAEKLENRQENMQILVVTGFLVLLVMVAVMVVGSVFPAKASLEDLERVRGDLLKTEVDLARLRDCVSKGGGRVCY